MKILHILRSKPDQLTRMFIDGMSPQGDRRREVPLYEGRVDYDGLVEQIFECDKVICWW